MESEVLRFSEGEFRPAWGIGSFGAFRVFEYERIGTSGGRCDILADMSPRDIFTSGADCTADVLRVAPVYSNCRLVGIRIFD